jgi:hypothetical protein
MNDLSHRQQNLGLGDGDPSKMLKRYLKCDAARVWFPDQRAVGYGDVVNRQGFVGVISSHSVVSILPLYKKHC